MLDYITGIQVLRNIFLVAALLLLPQPTWPGTITVGSIHRQAAAEIKKFSPLAAYLGKHLRSEGTSQGRVVVAKNIAQMAMFLREGRVDLFIDSPFPSLAVRRLSGSKFLLRRWKKGLAEYHSVIFTNKDSNLNRLEDLNGKVLAFEEPFSSSGYFFPKIVLMQEGLKLVPKADPTEPVGPREVGYVFSLDDENTVVWVLRGKVIAGVLDNQTYSEEARRNPNLKVIYKTFSFPRHILSYRADLPPKLVARVKEILIKMDQSEDGRKTLREFQQTTKFDELPDSSMAQLLKALPFVDLELRHE